MKKFFSLLLSSIIMLSLSSPALATTSNQFIIISKTNNTLYFFEDGILIDRFNVGTGVWDEFTPEGRFKIVNKIKDRPYFKKGIKGGDPNNPLGDRWLGLETRGTYGTTYGIHGNNDPYSIGGHVSAGCVRMYNEDIRWLFDRVKVGTPVVIHHTYKQAEVVASSYGYGMNGNVPVNSELP